MIRSKFIYIKDSRVDMDYHYLLLYHAPQIYGECVNIGPQIYRNSQRT